MNDDIERRLRESGAAEGWSLPPWPDPMTRLAVAMRRRQMTRRAVAAAGASLSVVALALGAATLLPHHDASGGVLAPGASPSSSVMPPSASSSTSVTPGPSASEPPSTSKSPSSSPEPSAAPCLLRTLRLRTTYDNVVAGHVETTYGFENTGQLPCAMTGYPHLRSLSASGAIVATAFRYTAEGFAGPISPTRTVRLAPGEIAHFDVVVQSTPCNAPDGALEFSPPGVSGALVQRGGLCAGQLVYVSPVYE
jgi:Protein of unknown function (DUF4232)